MKNIFIPKSTFLLLCFCSSFSQLNAGNDDGGEFVMQSPSKQLTVRVSVDDNHLSYRALHRRQTILEDSRLAWSVGSKEWGANVTGVRMVKGKKRTTGYPTIGSHSMAHNTYRAYTLDVREAAGSDYQIEFRLYDTGIAFRYLTSSDETCVVNDQTTFRLPAGADCWMQTNAKYYEDGYAHYESDNLLKDKVAGPPVTVKYPSGVYAAITEGNLVNFGGMGLKVVEADCFQSLPEGETTLSGEIATPWRIVMVGDLNSLVNNDIVSDVSSPLSPVFRGDTSWIKPGNCVWSWLAGYDVTLENMKKFTDWAAELGVPYNLVDEGWSHWEDKVGGKDAWQMVAELVEYSAKKGVKVWLWKAYPDRKGIDGLQTVERRRNFFRKCKELGIAGLKIDFFDSERQEVTKFYADALHDAAEYGLMINFHGSNKPTGLTRTYPNEVTREAILGLEYGSSSAYQDVVTPFSRFLAGHADYTPMSFEAWRMGNTTETHQIVQTAIFLSPFRCYGGRPEDYLRHPAKDIFLNIPTMWDETIVLSPSEVGECVLMARRKGADWYIAGMAGEKAVETTVPLSFLGKGTYSLTTLSDGDDRQCQMNRGELQRGDVLPVKMAMGGGFLAVLKPKK